ncbi:hypothetical protein ABZ684_17365 [Streptomyces sp. NPDC006995]|uniref:hypothetical protein n=1 Tax=Streptomyces sp. NPDC006995 TaxID=3156907 RepID=UPI0033D94577
MSAPGGNQSRLTSARAESTAARLPSLFWKAAHLRSRGEHGLNALVDADMIGSPPLERR